MNLVSDSSGQQYGQGREALMAATIDVVAERGLRGMTFRAVADAAGVNNALIAHHFGTREGLLIAALEWSTERMIQTSNLAVARSEPASFHIALEAAAATERSLLVFQYELILEASRNERLHEPVMSLYRAFFGALTQSGSAYLAHSRARFAAFDGLVLQLISGAISQEEFDDSLEVVLSFPWPNGL